MRAELHRRGIAQMRVSECVCLECFMIFLFRLSRVYDMSMILMQINNRSLQDMYLFGDPLLVPIIIVERMANVYRSASLDSSYISMENDARHVLLGNGSRSAKKWSGSSQQNGHVLRVVVFVHGFQACLTFLQLLLSY